MTEEERHAQQHEGLKRMEERAAHVEASALANAHRLKLHAPRKYARRASYSQRASLYHTYRAHLAVHKVDVPTFATMNELLRLHDEAHKEG